MKLRIGVLLWVLSWVPYGLLLGLSGGWLTLAWAFEILLGVVGLALAGTVFGRAIHEVGWKGAPRVAWHMLLVGDDSGEPVAEAP